MCLHSIKNKNKNKIKNKKIYTTTIKGKLLWPRRKAKYATHEQEIINECGRRKKRSWATGPCPLLTFASEKDSMLNEALSDH